MRAPLEPAEPVAVADPRLEGKFSPDFKLRALCEALQALSWRRGRLFRTGLLGQSCAADEFVCSREKPLRNGPPEITVLWGTPPFWDPASSVFKTAVASHVHFSLNGLTYPKVPNPGKYRTPWHVSYTCV